MTRRYSMCMSVRSFLTGSQFPDDFERMFKSIEGVGLTAAQAREHLFDELAQGHETIPLSGDCGNPCKNPGCAGFDYATDGGCPGFVVPPETPEIPT